MEIKVRDGLRNDSPEVKMQYVWNTGTFNTFKDTQNWAGDLKSEKYN